MKSKNGVQAALEGLRVGLKAYIIAYVTALAFALVINLSAIEKIQDYLQGTLSENVGFSFGLVIRSAAMMMNASVFNVSGTIQLGLLVFGVLPVAAFYLADRRDNLSEGLDMTSVMIYIVASVVFSVMVMGTSFFTKGELLGVDVNFVSWRNFFMTFIITLLIQVAIGLNYESSHLVGIKGIRWMLRLSLGTSGLVAGIGLGILLWLYTGHISLVLLGLLILLPNAAVYGFFMMFGVGVEFNESLQKLLAFANLDLSYTALPIGVRLVMFLLFLLFGVMGVHHLEKDRYWLALLTYATVVSLVSLLLAYTTVVDLGVVRGLMDIHFGINPLKAFLLPFAGLAVVGMLYHLVLRLWSQIRG